MLLSLLLSARISSKPPTLCMFESYISSCIHYLTPLTFHAESPLLVLRGETTEHQVNKALPRTFPSVKLFIRSLFTWICNDLLALENWRKIRKAGNKNTRFISIPVNNTDRFLHHYFIILLIKLNLKQLIYYFISELVLFSWL